MAWTFEWSALRKDCLAGLTVAAIAVPQAMAYALIAGLDPIYGLYSAIVVTAIASIFGSSVQLINGPTNAISLVVFSAVAFLERNGRDQAAEATFLLAAMVGLIQCGIAVFRLGDLTRYISESVVIGFMAGAGFLIALSQISNLFGLQAQGGGHLHLLHRLWLTITQGGAANPRAVAVGLGTMVLIVVLRRFTRKHRLPRVDLLLALIVASGVAALLGWTQPNPDGRSLIAVVGKVPAGLPMLHVPKIESAWIKEMAGSAVAIAFLGLLEALAIAKAIGHQTRQPLDYNQQCLAEGLGNLAGGFFQCLPGSGSLTRSSINYQAGAVTRFSGVIAAAAVALALVLLGPLAWYLPRSALAGLLLVTAPVWLTGRGCSTPGVPRATMPG